MLFGQIYNQSDNGTAKVVNKVCFINNFIKSFNEDVKLK
jgi:hypothetical protein